ncbi:hypothetical protein [Fuscibacter oryzae]|uniref:Uncharacterized protein n=1 Tax=Fuscibacter oryzae TaxID=2803939 RepID=A0A8J7MTH4_9RHOB|nr:hypothetical protein [Fuscibacter oryzae]MBL4929332.1 hypothetical protein [Fuscibacter oryzae]
MIWNVIFGPRPPLWNLPALILWSLFGNFEDGPYGIYEAEALGARDWRTAWRWWNRNPLHNLWFHTLAVPLWWTLCLIGRPDDRNYWPAANTGLILALNPLPYIAWRTRSWEGYFGYRPQKQKSGRKIGAFGIALRHR